MTSVEWLFEKLWQLPKDKFTWYNVLEQAKEIERQAMIDFGNDLIAQNDTNYIGIPNLAEQYYNETYGSKGSDERIVEATKTIISQTEISDEEIEKAIIDQDVVKQEGYCHCFLEGAKWYREQLKKKQ